MKNLQHFCGRDGQEMHPKEEGDKKKLRNLFQELNALLDAQENGLLNGRFKKKKEKWWFKIMTENQAPS